MEARNVFITLFLVVLGVISTECCILSAKNKFANCFPLGFKNITLNLPLWVNHIDLSENYIERIRDGDFRRLVNLRSINLDNNKITTIEENAFYNLARLKTSSTTQKYGYN